MKKLFFLLISVMFFLASCGSGNKTSNTSNTSGTHTHADGTVHSHDCDHETDEKPDGQESFVLDSEDESDHNHSHDHGHDHDHNH
jgi:hypothetical protein